MVGVIVNLALFFAWHVIWPAGWRAAEALGGPDPLALAIGVVAAVALFFSMSFSGLVPAIAATAGLYFLGRSISTVQAIAAGPLAEAQNGTLRGIVDSLALLVPKLDAVTRTEWLVYGLPGLSDLLAAVAGLAIYCVLLAAAGLFDFSRRDL